MSLLYDLEEQACRIYVTRVLIGPDGPALTQLVDRFKNTMESLPANSPGEHTLVWATFMAASESSTPEHQQYFKEVLKRHHQRNGFANILTALRHLQGIWAARTAQDWTEVLPNLKIFLA